MKIQPVYIIVLFLVLGTSLTAQTEQPQTTFYLKAPQFLFPTESFGYPSDYPKGIILSGYGFGVGIGSMMYPEKLHITSMLHLGVDMTIAELNLLSTDYIETNNDYWSSPDKKNSFSLGSKLGPVLSVQPTDKFLLDVYAQAKYGFLSLRYYDPLEDDFYNTDKFGLNFASGINMGWNIFYLSMEYVYGSTKIQDKIYVNNMYVLKNMNIKNSYFKVSVLFKFQAFD